MLGASGVIFKFYSIFSMKILYANRIAPDGTPRSAASHLGVFCLLMSHERDARLKCVNDTILHQPFVTTAPPRTWKGEDYDFSVFNTIL